MPQITIQDRSTGLQEDLVSTFSRSASTASVFDRNPSTSTGLPIGYAGTLSTRTSDTQGTATLGGGHGITTGMEVDVYWTGGVRYGMTVGTVSGASVPLSDSGAGDVLPVETTAIIVAQRVEIGETIDGDALVYWAANLTYPLDPTSQAAGRCHVESRDGADAEIADSAFEIAARVMKKVDVPTSGSVNPWAGEVVAKLIASQSNTTYVARLQAHWLQNT